MLPLDVKKRSEYILNAVKENKVFYQWTPIASTYKDHAATFWVTSDALKLNGIRFTVSAFQQQQIADLLNASLLTPKLADLRHAQSEVTLNPVFRTITNTTEQMIKQSQDIDKLLSSDDMLKLIDTVGKHWVICDEVLDLTGQPKKDKYNEFLATNYGFHHTAGFTFKGIKSYLCDSKINKEQKQIYVIQSSAQAHNCKHEDYSQNCVLVFNLCLVDGKIMNLKDVLSDSQLSYLASHIGPVKVLRQPGPEPLAPIVNYVEPAAFKSANIEFDEPSFAEDTLKNEPIAQEETQPESNDLDVVDLSDLDDLTDTPKPEISTSNPITETKKAQPAWIELLTKIIEFILSLLKKK